MSLLEELNKKKLTIEDNSGYVMTLMVIILSSIMLVIISSASFSSLTSLKKSQVTIEDQQIESFTSGCAEEALLQLSRSSSYDGDTYNLHGGTCVIGITSSKNTSTISVTGTKSNLNHNYKIEVSLEPFKIINWEH